MEQNDRPELLAPAGNWDCARAAVAAGADAIYFGLPKFNARLRADNFTADDLPELMDYLHRHGVRGFLTMNTLVFTNELDEAEEQLRTIAAAGVDAIIVQDLGLAVLAQRIAPEVEIHASTQMTITSPEGLALIESIVPLTRAVLARELSIREIARFRLAARLACPTVTPLEVFVHGALCVAYSGQCLTSEALGQRSANRGECAQACRMPYEIVVDGVVRDLGEVRYLLSPQDLAAVDCIPELVRAGVRSFKIEGRLKSPEYVTAVTRVYRKALDAAIAGAPTDVTDADRYSLEMTFSRGLSTGWLAGTNHPYLTHGRFGKKRGPLLGTIVECGNGWVRLDPRTEAPLAAGDGVVFDAGENRDHEQGARIWKIEDDRLLFHRVHSGLDFTRIRPGQTLWKTSDPQLDAELKRFRKSTHPKERKIALNAVVTGAVGEPMRIHCDGHTHTGTALLAKAAQHPLDQAVLTAQLGRLGGTRYELASLDCRLEGPCHLPLSELNRIRREWVAAMDARSVSKHNPPAVVTSWRDQVPSSGSRIKQAPVLAVLCRNDDQLHAALAAGVTKIYCDYEDPRRYRDAVAIFRESASTEASIHLATPRILKPGETGYLKLIESAAPDGVLLRNLGALHHHRQHRHLAATADFSLNVANPVTAAVLMKHTCVDRLTVSYDLNIAQVLDLLSAAPPEWFELTLHQHMPMFHMEHCVFCVFLSSGSSWKDCGRPCERHVVHLRDRVGQLHRLQADVGCRNTLFNGRAQTGVRFLPQLLAAGLRYFRIELLDEDRNGAFNTICAYQDLLADKAEIHEVLGRVKALERLGVTEGTLAQAAVATQERLK